MNNIAPSMVKERIRLIKPTRPQAPTEYNLQYKKWPLRPFTLETFRVVKKQPKKEPIEHRDPLTITQPIHGLCKMESFNSDYPCSTASSDGLPTAAVEKRQNKTNDSIVALPPSVDESEVIDESLTSTLRTQTAKMHARQPKPKSPRKPGKPVVKSASKNRMGRSGSSFQAAESFPLAPEEEFSAKLRYLTAYSNIASTKGTYSSSGTSKPRKCRNNQSHHRNNQSRRQAWGREEDPNIRTGHQGHSIEPTNTIPEHTSQVSTPRSAPKQRTNDKLRLGDLCKAIDSMNEDGRQWASDQPPNTEYLQNLPSENSLDKINPVRSESIIHMKPFDQQTTDLPRTPQKSRKHLVSKEGRRSKPFSVDSVGEDSLRQLYSNIPPNDLETLRQTYKGLLGAGEERGDDGRKQFASCYDDTDHIKETFKIKQGWNSSYSIDFKNWYASHYDDVRSKCATQTSEATDKEKLLTEGPPCSECPVSKTQSCAQDQLQSSGVEDLEKKVNFQAKTPDPRVTERDRLIKEADDIEEKEFQALFGPGGKMKMNMTSSSAFKAHKPKPPEAPIWANKTIVSLGSGHWNLPMNKGEEWKVQIPEDGKVPVGQKPEYKIRVHNDAKSSDVPMTDLESNEKKTDRTNSDPFIALYYPDRRTTSSYVSEYMRKFHRFPVQKKRVLV